MLFYSSELQERVNGNILILPHYDYDDVPDCESPAPLLILDNFD